jgi:hypothetical protein
MLYDRDREAWFEAIHLEMTGEAYVGEDDAGEEDDADSGGEEDASEEVVVAR